MQSPAPPKLTVVCGRKYFAKMPRRAASPAGSEPELDILNSLYPGDDQNTAKPAKNQDDDLDFDNLINGPQEDGGSDADGDEAFIALKQAASFRKAAHLKGRTVKRGGGFQAMGKLSLHGIE